MNPFHTPASESSGPSLAREPQESAGAPTPLLALGHAARASAWELSGHGPAARAEVERRSDEPGTAQHSAVPNSAAEHGAVQYSAAEHSAAQYSGAGLGGVGHPSVGQYSGGVPDEVNPERHGHASHGVPARSGSAPAASVEKATSPVAAFPTLHHPGGPQAVASEVVVPDLDAAIGELPGLLVRAESGTEFIYQALEIVAARYGLRDLVVTVEHNDRPQVFRLGRAPLATSAKPLPSYLRTALNGRPGVYGDPPVVGPVLRASLTSLVELALRLDFLEHDASHDALTGLLNRRSYELLLDQAVSRARRYGWPFALVLLDLDDFKFVNDRYGHASGDAALRAVGTELRAALRGGDVAARLGGDEFALLVVGVENVSSLSPILGRLERALEKAVPETRVGFSVGVACFPSDTDDPDALTGLADERLYAAKATIA
ncbi:MAG TPA: GGDEF domain-containing protein [Acidimicrobiales bacterium]|nr:GGDEF domain-containing protein [Acidimicrobiales bacterium]